MKLATSRFTRSIAANLDYWCDRIDEIGDPALRELIPENQNIFRAVEFALALPDSWRAAAEIIVALNTFIEHSGNYRPWQVMIQNTLARCDEGDTRLKLRLLDLAGLYYRKERDWDSSLAAYLQEERLGDETGSTEHLAQAHWGLGAVYWRLRDYDTAMCYSQQALEEFQAIGASERQLGGVFTNLGLVYYGRGNYEEAVETHAMAVDHFRRSNYEILLARSLVNLALAQEAAGEVEQAMESYLEARSFLDQSGYEMDMARLELSLGSLLFNMNRFEEAESAYMRAYSPYLKRSGAPYLRGLATNNLACVYIEQGRLKEAEAMLQKSLMYWERVDAPLQIANTTANIAKNLAAQGRCLEAESQYNKAIAAANAYPEDGYARSILAECQEAMAELMQKTRNGGQAI